VLLTVFPGVPTLMTLNDLGIQKVVFSDFFSG